MQPSKGAQLARKSDSTTRTCSTAATFPSNSAIQISSDRRTRLIYETARGSQYLLIISDRVTKYTKSVPLKSISASKLAKVFIREWVFNYGFSMDLLSDNEKCVTAKFIQEVCRNMNIHNSFTRTYHPQTSEQTERFNRTLKVGIRSYRGDHLTD